ncbi:MOSC domain-containing protein [Geodermatophilus sp. YIM 151500]|uniref:MOSC domain-containing protein n=1 Tax=Geodermatophilus sp. YIM 151500 TaxID=2984531 RepID=UPI0021E3AE89|nr:MOSC domain-containing protein [Geodermatophilus sp. YIM 151500]MCV2491420.1 MOSC domain-containing protein [Geodermatophilus sp. YIM 151500]
MDDVVGRVARISVYPVRSLAGRDLDTADVGPAGLAGDRTWVVLGPDGAPLRGRDAPALAGLPATGDPGVDAATVAAALGRAVELAPSGAREGVAPVHLVSRQAVDRAAAGDVPEGCSADDPRANLLLDLDGGADERAWVGTTLEVGSAVLRVTRTPKHCLGVYADVQAPGRVAVGDPVRRRPGPAGAPDLGGAGRPGDQPRTTGTSR